MKRFAVLIGMLLAAACTYASPIPGPDYTNPVNVTLLSFQRRRLAERLPIHRWHITELQARFDAMCDDYAHGGCNWRIVGKPILRTWEAMT